MPLKSKSIERYSVHAASEREFCTAIQDWFNLLHFEFDKSVPNAGHLDPQQEGCCTTFLYFVGKLLEVPVTMSQDFMLFNILRQYSLDLWERQIKLVLKGHGVMNFIALPDYVINQREQNVYKSLLGRLAELRKEELWGLDTVAGRSQ